MFFLLEKKASEIAVYPWARLGILREGKIDPVIFVHAKSSRWRHPLHDSTNQLKTIHEPIQKYQLQKRKKLSNTKAE